VMNGECGTMNGLPAACNGSGRQLVYRQKRTDPLPVEERQDVEFRLIATPWGLRSLGTEMRRLFGLVGMLKTAVKLATPSRLLYVVMVKDGIVNWGWVSISFCRHYPVGAKDVVVGPVATAPECRGQGLATIGLTMAINAMMKRGHRVFFIDTSSDNKAMQKVIARCGFGEPISSYRRGA
jgi:hypothetical protein